MSSIERREQDLAMSRRAPARYFDVTGAGDTVIARLGCAYAVGAAFQVAIELENVAAGTSSGAGGRAGRSRRWAEILHELAQTGEPMRRSSPAAPALSAPLSSKGFNERGGRDVLEADDL